MATDAASPDGAGHDLANAMLGAMLAQVREVGGDDAVRRVLAEAGEARAPAEIEDPVGWSTYAQGLALFHAATRVLDDPAAARKAGARVMDRYRGSETVSLLRSLGSPAALFQVYPAISAKQSAVTRAEVIEVGDAHAVIAVVTAPPIVRDAVFCDYTAGALAQFPTLFGMAPAQVEEVECQTRGDARCLLQVAWDAASSVQQSLQDEVTALREQVAALTTRYEALEAAAVELSSASDVTSTLQAIIRQAGMAVRAPSYLLSVRLPRDRTWRVHHVGFASDADAAAAAERLQRAASSGGEGGDGGEGMICVDVASARARYGKLAAFHRPGFPFMPNEQALLAAYAGHAAAALETAAALDEARERNQTLGTLLALGTALAEAGSRIEVAERLAQALVDILGAAEAHVLLWDAGEATLTRVASAGDALLGRALPEATRLREPLVPPRLTVTPGPTVVSPLSDPVTRGVLSLTGLGSGVLVPVTAHGTLFAVAAAGLKEGAELDDAARERLTGIASLAATASNSAHLLDEARHQALHDPLTDLPNPRLFEERVGQALAMARRTGERLAICYLDLDRFKVVNDTHGHAAGDELLRAVADRLRSSVRREDTVARMGGDEFAVLLQNVGNAEHAATVAATVVAALGRPFALRLGPVTIGASVGVTLCPEHGDGYASVVARADAAMYRAKAAGRGCFHLVDGAAAPPDGHQALAPPA